jgi:hypothetical protein
MPFTRGDDGGDGEEGASRGKKWVVRIWYRGKLERQRLKSRGVTTLRERSPTRHLAANRSVALSPRRSSLPLLRARYPVLSLLGGRPVGRDTPLKRGCVAITCYWSFGCLARKAEGAQPVHSSVALRGVRTKL